MVRAVGVGAVWLAGIATSQVASADLAEIRQRGALRVIVSADELPQMFSFEDSDRPGLEREIVESFARSQGLELEVVKVATFDQVIPTLVDGGGDMVVGLIATQARRALIDFTVETMPARHVAVNLRSAPPVAAAEELRAVRVGVVVDSSWDEAAREAGVPDDRRIPFEGTEPMLAALRGGSVQAAVMSVTDFALSQAADPRLQAGCFVGRASSAAWGIRKTDPELRAALDEHIGQLQRSPAWSKLVLRYYTQDALALLARARKD
jgi:ABC-type amino acid transport substrate-binding protein